MDKKELKELKEKLKSSINGLKIKDFEINSNDNILLFDNDEYRLGLEIK